MANLVGGTAVVSEIVEFDETAWSSLRTSTLGTFGPGNGAAQYPARGAAALMLTLLTDVTLPVIGLWADLDSTSMTELLFGDRPERVAALLVILADFAADEAERVQALTEASSAGRHSEAASVAFDLALALALDDRVLDWLVDAGLDSLSEGGAVLLERVARAVGRIALSTLSFDLPVEVLDVLFADLQVATAIRRCAAEDAYAVCLDPATHCAAAAADLGEDCATAAECSTGNCSRGVCSPRRSVYVAPGTFLMGSPPAEAGRYDPEVDTEDLVELDETQHEVTLTRGFWMEQSEVRLDDWLAAFGELPAHYAFSPHLAVCDGCPVVTASWVDALKYANAVSERDGLQPCYELTGTCPPGLDRDCLFSGLTATTVYDCEGWRLPTEAEWEYAARAGTRGATWNGDLVGVSWSGSGCVHQTVLDAIEWYCGNADVARRVQTRRANPWGLYDVLGNVPEWCWDLARPSVPAPSGTDPVADPPPNVEWTGRRIRGCSVRASSPAGCRAAARSFFDGPGNPLDVGLRLVRTVR